VVTVIIPNYNYAAFIEKRISTVLNQTIKPGEILFLDDHSSDNSIEIAEQLLSKSAIPYKIIPNDKNSGNVFSQWQKGYEQAQGKYLWIAEADDAAHPSFLENTLKAMENPNIGLAYTETAAINEKNRVFDWNFYKRIHDPIDPDKWKKSYTNTGKKEIEQSLIIRNTIPNVSAVLFRIEALKSTGGFITDFQLSGDWASYMEILKNWDIAYIHKRLNYQRFHNQRLTNNLNFTTLQSKEALSIIVNCTKIGNFSKVQLNKGLETVIRWLLLGGFEKDKITEFIHEEAPELWTDLASDINQLLVNLESRRDKKITLEKIWAKCRRIKI